MSSFKNEWAILHNDIERYERFSLIIKLFSVFVSIIAIAHSVTWWIAITLILVLWLQDAIWKTFQKRTETRVLFIEEKIKHSADEAEAFQFYSEWENNRQGMVGLVKEYISSALKPTIAFPYVVLVPLTLAFYIFI
jgi:hypothetical protein